MYYESSIIHSQRILHPDSSVFIYGGSHPFYVAAEADAVTLYMDVANFREKLVEKAVALVKVDYFHKHFQVLRSFII